MRLTWLCGIILVVLVALTSAGCTAFGFIVGTGAIVEKTYDYQDFDEVEIANNFQFEISYAETFSVSISTHENIFNYLDIAQTGSTLQIKLRSGSFSSTDAKAAITMPALRGLTVSGDSHGNARGFNSTDDFKAVASGTSSIDLDMTAGTTEIDLSGIGKMTGILNAGDTRINISGVSRCEIRGTAGTTQIDVSGASHFDAPDFEMQNTDITVSGASGAEVKTAGDLNIEATGASTVDYYGSPNIKNVEFSGASSVHKK